MAASTALYAVGDMSHYELGEESRKLSGKRRRTVVSSIAARPLFVAEADFRAGKVFTRLKKGMLALYGTALQVVDVEAADAAGGLADVTAHVLRWVNYTDLLDVSFTGPATLKIQHGDTSDKPKLLGDLMLTADDSSSDTASQHTVSYGGALAAASAPVPMSAPAAVTATASSSSAASMRVTYESFTLTFREAGIAQQAAAALLFQTAQNAALRNWLSLGLHAGFRCDLICVTALPLMFDDQQHALAGSSSTGGPPGLVRSHSLLPPHMLYSCASGCYSRTSLSGAAPHLQHQQHYQPVAAAAGANAGPFAKHGAAAAAAAAAAAPPAAPYTWGSVDGAEWGCSLPLPLGWGAVLDAAAAAAAGSDGDGADQEQGSTPEELTCPVVLDHGPKALQVTISTPLGAAVATITPQLTKAALLHSSCRDVLALPLHATNSGSSSSGSSAPAVAFSWNVQGNVSAAAAAVGGSGADGGTAGSSSNITAAAQESEDSASSVNGTSSSTGGLNLTHTVDAFASLQIQVVRTPATAGTKGTVAQLDSPQTAPSAAGAPAAGKLQPAVAEPTPSSSRSSSWQNNSNVQLQLAVCALLAAVAVSQCLRQPLLCLLQLLLLAAVAYSAIAAADSSSAAAAAYAQQQQQQQQQRAAANAALGSSESSSTEDAHCCGWSIQLVSADVCSSPSRHLQLQVSLAKASRGMARLRLRLASMSAGGAAVPLLPTPSEDDVAVPVLVSEPEPIWLNKDTKQRFINAKPTLESSQEQARRTNKWRQNMGVDTVLTRPCPKFPLMCKLLPTYLLSDNSPEGHAVVLMKIGGVKDLCDAIFQKPEGGPDSLTLLEAEHTLSLLNEYLVQVAAPRPLPAGFQVQIYDLAGFKLSYVCGDMFTLFKMLVRFGLYYPERLHLALVINAPVWFSTPWKAMNAFLDANTSAKVVVVGAPKGALSTLAHHLGGLDKVPVAWGGTCTLPFEDYPANKRMMEFGAQLNAGQQPFPGLQRS